jgi:hypothetical protein
MIRPGPRKTWNSMSNGLPHLSIRRNFTIRIERKRKRDVKPYDDAFCALRAIFPIEPPL